jgi:integrase
LAAKDKLTASEWLFAQRKAISDHSLPVDEKTTLNDFADRFMEEVAKHTLKEKTLVTYESYLKVHIRPELGRMKLALIQPQHIQSLYKDKLNSGLSKKTVHHIHATLRRILNEAVKRGIIHKNPCTSVTPPRVDRHAPSVWTIEEAKTFLSAVEGHRWHGVYLIALTTGARRGEILGMEWQNINWTKGTVTIVKTISEIKGKAVVTNPKTKLSRRTIALPVVVLELLKLNQKSTGWVFPSERGTQMSPRNLLRHFYSVLERLDIPKIRFHDLRHTAATILLQKDVHPKKVQELLGHSSITLTLDTYSHIIPGIDSQTSREMDKVFRDI